MSVLYAFILGVIQGVTEFLPVSSSGHLILVRDVLGLPVAGGLAFDAVLHLATALAVLIYFWRDAVSFLAVMKERGPRVLLGAIVLGTLPAVVVGLFFGDAIESTLRSSLVVAGALLAGSLLFLIAERFYAASITAGRGYEPVTPKKGFIVGLFQTLALIPGLSRSGASISGGLLLGFSRETATRFAFLLSFPILFGVGLSKFFEIGSGGLLASWGFPLFVGSLAAFATGLASIHFMIRFLKTHTLYPFVVYRVILAVIVLVAMIF